MSTGICIIVGVLALAVGFFLGKNDRSKSVIINPYDFVAKINFAIGEENEALKEKNELLVKKNLFLGEWFLRNYVEQYHRKKLALGDERLYTADALEDLKNYAKEALDNFEKTWNSEFYNEQCEWVKEYLEGLILKIDSLLDDKFDGDIIDLNNEDAFRRFFVGVETNMFFDKSAKKAGREETRLTYWKPQREYDDEF